MRAGGGRSGRFNRYNGGQSPSNTGKATMFEKKAITSTPVNDLLARRWSGVSYNPDRPVEADKLSACIESARWAPSCYGAQPWSFIVCDRSRDEAAWQAALACLVEANRDWAQHAPALILALAREHFQHNDKPNRWAQYDTGAAAISLCLQATDLGLMAHQMGGFDVDQSITAFDVPAGHTPMAMIAIGYQTAQEDVPEKRREREFAPRRRNPLKEHFFFGAWGKGS